MEVSIIAIGDELLIGQVVDTNSGALARMMEPEGWRVRSVRIVRDDASEIRSAVEAAMAETPVVLTTGGLGPTKDDITKVTLCDIFGGTLQIDPEVTANILEVFRRRGIKMNALTEQQALVPTSCRVIQNRLGTAPIMWFDGHEGHVLVSMPGVPFETLGMFAEAVLPQLLERFRSEEAVAHRTLIVADMTESLVAMALDEWERALPPYIHLAYLPKPGLIRLRLDGRHTDRPGLEKVLDSLHADLCSHFADNLLASADLSPAEALIERLRAKGLTVATAESCTGGTIASRITAVAGCSDVFRGAVVAYANDVKTAILGVDPAAIAAHGVVSEEVVRQMADGVRKTVGADCAIATSGIAGPGGATPGKPVGTVCVALATPEAVVATTLHLPGNRERVIDRTATTTLARLAMLLC